MPFKGVVLVDQLDYFRQEFMVEELYYFLDVLNSDFCTFYETLNPLIKIS